MKHIAVTGFLLLSVAFMVFFVVEAPRGQILSARTVPTKQQISQRFTHYKYTGHAMCDLGRMVGLCGDVGSLTQRGSGGF